MNEADLALLASALLMGLAGSGHCLVMCGGIASVPASRVDQDRPMLASTTRLLAFNSGRLLGYLVLGAAAAGLSSAAMFTLDHALAARFSRLAVALVLALSGIRLLLGRDVMGLERVGTRFWQWLRPWTGRLQQLPGTLRWPLLGLCWGWLPCGLVYSAAGLSLATGDMRQGVLVMLAFGLGTLPSMLASGASSSLLVGLFRRPWLQHAGGLLLLLAAAWTLLFALGLWPTGTAMEHHH